jgi:hypothetical protein
MRRRIRPRRPSRPTTPPRIIGARRLALLKPEDCGCWTTEPVVLCNDGVLVVDEIVGVELVAEAEGVTELTLAKERMDHELLVVLKMLRVF